MTVASRPELILASQSPRRLSLLAQIGVSPDKVVPADINEAWTSGEVPKSYALRVACEKAEAVAESHKGSIILAADTVVGLGRRILPKAETEEQARGCLALLSGRNHRVYTAVALITPSGTLKTRVVETRLKMKTLSQAELNAYIASGEWDGKAGGYGIQGIADSFIHSIIGSYSNVVGLPLFETRNLLVGSGFKI